MTATGALGVICGPSGVGKGTVIAELRRRRPDVVTSVSATTRPQRPGERHGVDYLFLRDDEFTQLIDDGVLLEWAEFAGRRYGTPAMPVRAARAEGRTVVLEIDVQGARQVRQAEPSAQLIFLAPPSLEALAARLRGRGTDTDEAVAARLAAAESELAAADEFDHVVVNHDVSEAAAEIDRILGR